MELTINNKKILIQKENNKAKDYEVELAIKDIVKNNIELPIEKKIDLSEVCSCFFSIIYKGIITIIESKNGIEIPITKIVYKIC